MVVMMSQGTCFHCGRKLSEMGSNPDDCGCSYCSILRNILEQDSVSHLEKCVMHMLDFAKSAVLFFPDFGTKNDGILSDLCVI